MGEWKRDTPWRQGDLLTPETIKALGLDKADHETVAVVISHDCDLAQLSASEPMCEIIVGQTVDQADGTYTWARSARRIHLPFSGGEVKIVADLQATDRRSVEKAVLVDHTPVSNSKLSPSELDILQRWLAARYRRSAFPDAFERRLKAKPGKVLEKLAQLLAKTDDHIVAILFDLDRGKMVEREASDDVYELSIILVHSVEKDPAASLKVATEAAKTIREIFRKAFLADGKWHDIELRDAIPASEDGVTVRQSRLLKRWNVDYLSLKTEEGGPILEG